MDEREKLSLVTGKGMWHVGTSRQIIVSDGPSGLRKQSEDAATNNDSILSTLYPTAVTLACSWDTALVSQAADALANECIGEDVSVLLGPGVNIKRSPFGGRNFEYYSEDPYLAGMIGSAFVKALEERGVGTSLKHFAGNSQERYRMTSNSMIDDRALHEIYLRAFEIVVKTAHPSTVMASYNRLNGTYSCENRKLLTDILRKQWGFEGAVISDWGACTDLPASISAGMDLEMPDSIGFHQPELEKALSEDQDGQMHEALNRAAGKVQELIDRLNPDDPRRTYHKDTDPHAVSLKAALGGAVLLKNEHILPLPEGARVFPAGPLCKAMRIQGGGSSHIRIRKQPDMEEKLKQVFEVQAAAKDADCILCFGGLTEETEGEGFDRTSLELPKEQAAEIRKLLDTGKPVVFIAFGGSPFVIPYRDQLAAILYMGLPGEAADQAVIDLIFGKVSPSGKLAETWPLRYEDVPCHKTFAKDTKDIEYRESIYVGYRYYDTFGIPVQYSFGYGLSYTNFAYSDLSCEDGIVSVTIENTGGFDGAEIVQIYIQNPSGGTIAEGQVNIENPASGWIREKRSLRGFAKAELKKGEKKRVRIPLDDRTFQIWDTGRQDFVTVAGDYILQAGASLDDIRLEETVHVPEAGASQFDEAEYADTDTCIEYQKVDARTGNVTPSYPGPSSLTSYFAAPGSRPSFTEADFRKLYGRKFSTFSRRQKGTYDRTASLTELAGSSPLARLLLKIAEKLILKMFPGRSKDDPEVRMSMEGMLDGTIDAVAIQSGGIVKKQMVKALIDDANGHHLAAFGDLIGGGRHET